MNRIRDGGVSVTAGASGIRNVIITSGHHQLVYANKPDHLEEMHELLKNDLRELKKKKTRKKLLLHLF